MQTDVLRDVILDTGVMYVKAVQTHNALVDMIPSGKLLMLVFVSCALGLVTSSSADKRWTHPDLLYHTWAKFHNCPTRHVQIQFSGM